MVNNQFHIKPSYINLARGPLSYKASLPCRTRDREFSQKRMAVAVKH